MEKNINVRKKVLLSFIFTSIFLLCGVTFANWIWETTADEWSNVDFVVENIEAGFTCSADGGGEILSNEVLLVPASCSSAENVIMREITTSVEIQNQNLVSIDGVLMNLWLDVNYIGEELSVSENFMYAITTSPDSCSSNVVASGNFNGKTAGSKVDLLSDNFATTSSNKYYLYIWLDEAETNVNTANQSFDLSLGGDCEALISSIVDFDMNGGTIASDFATVSYTTSGEHQFTVPASGIYKLEVWGASGGKSTSNYTPGYGGYSVGNIQLSKDTSLYVNVGGTGSNASNNSTFVNGGYNGGGKANYNAGTGGGATHIAFVSGQLSSLNVSTNINDILIVAGGGGGAGKYNTNEKGGSGGGATGVDGGDYRSSNAGGGGGGTQIAGGTLGTGTTAGTVGSFGVGGQGGYRSSNGSGGGGGGFYGGAGGSGNYGGGGGGSGYIGNSLLTDKAMYCYSCTPEDDVNSLTYSVSVQPSSTTATSQAPKSGDGAASISLIAINDFNKKVIKGDVYGELPIPTKNGYFFVGWFTSLEGGELVTEDTVVDLLYNHTLYARWGLVETYVVSYDANGGSGVPANQIKTQGETLTLSSDIPTRSGYRFLGWSTDSSATTATYSVGGSYTEDAPIKLYAIWEEITEYTISYNANGGSGAPASQIKIQGETLKLSTTVPTRSGYSFLGWSTSSSATTATYSAGGSYTNDSAATLYAVWQANTYYVKYNANGGSGTMSNSTYTYDIAKKLTANSFTRNGYAFNGWNTKANGTGTSYADQASVKNLTSTNGETINLYAQWEETVTYLYNLGDENTSFTGGWIQHAIYFSNESGSASSPYLTKNANNMYIYGSSSTQGLIRVNNMIDLTNYNTLYFTATVTSSLTKEHDRWFDCAIWSQLNDYKGFVNYQSAYYCLEGVNSSGEQTFSIDVSGLSGSYYIGISMRSNYSTIRLTKMWLE